MINRGAVATICEAALASPAQTILEIGPGHGAVTDCLLKDGRPLIAVELDSDACQILGLRYGRAPNFSLLHGDAVTIGLPPGKDLCIVGNLPYNAATAILTRFLTEPFPWERMVLMFQLEVGQKLMGRPGEKSYGPLSILAQGTTIMTTVLKLGPGSFSPPPKVDSIVILFSQKPGAPTIAGRGALLKALHLSFAHRRKTLANNWSSVFSRQQISTICEATDIQPNDRAEALPPSKWLEIARRIIECGDGFK